MKNPFKTIMGTAILLANLFLCGVFASSYIKGDLKELLADDTVLKKVALSVYGSSLAAGFAIYLVHRAESPRSEK